MVELLSGLSQLRWFGLIVGLLAFFYGIFKLRSHSETRKDVWLMFLFGAGLVLISLFPSLINLPTDFFSLGNKPAGRLIALLILSSVLLWLLVIYQRGKFQNLHAQVDRLVRMMTIDSFLQANKVPKNKKSILILIPAYNEDENIRQVIPEIPKSILGYKVIPLVINDGSSDNSRQAAMETGALLANHPVNRGGGAALKTGYDIARIFQLSILVTMDADGQHDPDELETVVKPIIEGEADFVIGSRVLGSMDDYSRLRWAGVHFFNFLINMLMGTKITDCSSGYRAVTIDVLNQCKLIEEQYHSTELIIEAAKRKFRIKDVPIHIAARISGESKKGKALKYSLFFLRTIIKTWLR